jgi:hypothetical protein
VLPSPPVSWRPNGDGSKNLRHTVPNPAKRAAPPPPKPRKTPKVVRILELARTWQALLDRREVRTRAALAKRTGLCAVYVGNILALLRFHPAILERLEKLEAGGTGTEVTERWLRPIVRLPHAEQLVAVAARLNVAQLSMFSGANAKKRGKL